MTDPSQMTHCTDCGAEVAPADSFCPSCGASVDADTESRDLQQAASVATENSKVRPELLANMREPKFWLSGARSEGDYMLYDAPLITHIQSDEDVMYVLVNKTTGPKIQRPDGSEDKPHSGGRHCFILVTDQRLVYVAAHDGEDHVREWPYSEITGLGVFGEGEGVTFSLKKQFQFHTEDGYDYFFRDNSTMPNYTRDEVNKYVRKQALGGVSSIFKDILFNW